MLQRRKRLEADLALDNELRQAVEDLEAYFDLGAEGEDVAQDIQKEITRLENWLGEVETRTLLSGENARANAFLTIPPRSRGYRVARLGRNAVAHVPALG